MLHHSNLTLSLSAIETELDARRLKIRMTNGRVWDSVRRNGKTQTWKTRPGEFRIPIKYGFKGYGEITNRTEIVELSPGIFAI